jgi:hypothetical protein
MLQYSPKIITDSLVMCLDASQNKSYPAADLPVKNGLVMWMDAADDTTFSYSSGTTVSQWRDKSGYNYHMVPKVNGPTRSVFLNSRKVLAFTAVQTIGNDVIDLSSTTSTVFVVSRYTSGTNQRVLTCNLDSGGGNWLLGHWGGYVNQYYAEGWVSYQVYGNDTVWRVYMGDYSGPPAGANTDLANIYSNGTAIVTNSTAASGGLRKLGINYYSNETSTCEVAEIIVFNRVLTVTERRLVHTYLGQKWGISNTDRSIVDLSNNNNHGLLGGVAGSQVVADMPLFDVYNKGALKLDGSTDYIAVENATSLNPTTVTVSIWVKRNGYQSQTANYLRRNYNDAYAILSSPTDDSSLRFRIHNGTTYPESPTTTLALNEWTNIVGTYDLANIKIYKNGVFVGQTAHTSAISYASANTTLTIGRDDPIAGRYMNANYGSVLIYSRALSAVEVAQNYEAQKSKFADTIVQQGLVLNVDAGNPYSYAGAGTTWYDVSGNAIDASASGTSSYINLYGGLLSFPNNNSYYNTSAVSTFNLGASSFSMECWVYLDAATASDNAYRGIISLGLSSTNYVYIAKWRSGLYSGLYVQYIAAGSTVTGVYQANDYNPVSRWTHVVATKSSNVLYFYVNGVLYSTASDLNTTFNGNSSVYIAQAHGGVNSLYGYVGESRVYNIALSAAQVLQNYNATKGRFGL